MVLRRPEIKEERIVAKSATRNGKSASLLHAGLSPNLHHIVGISK